MIFKYGGRPNPQTFAPSNLSKILPYYNWGAPWYMTNLSLHNDLKVINVTDYVDLRF